MKKIKKVVGITLISFLALLLSGCAFYWRGSSIEYFDDFLRSLVVFEKESESPVPEIPGFTPLLDVSFSYGTSFSGNYSFAKVDDYSLILRKCGRLYFSTSNLQGIQFNNDRYIFEENSMLGVKGIFSNIIVPPLYSSIRFFGNTIAALDSFERVCIFYNNRQIARRSDFFVIADGHFTRGGYHYNANLERRFVDGLAVVSAFSNDFYIITDGNLFGFATKEQVVIKPQFVAANSFNGFGYALAYTENGGSLQAHIINTKGEIVVSENCFFAPVAFDGEFIIFTDEWGMFGVADSYFNAITTDNSFWWISHQQAFANDIVIVAEPFFYQERFFSLSQNEFVSQFYTNILPSNGFFIVTDILGRYSLYTHCLTVVISNQTYIALSGEILLVENENKVHFYKVA